jgi:hypothetical protein
MCRRIKAAGQIWIMITKLTACDVIIWRNILIDRSVHMSEGLGRFSTIFGSSPRCPLLRMRDWSFGYRIQTGEDRSNMIDLSCRWWKNMLHSLIKDPDGLIWDQIWLTLTEPGLSFATACWVTIQLYCTDTVSCRSWTQCFYCAVLAFLWACYYLAITEDDRSVRMLPIKECVPVICLAARSCHHSPHAIISFYSHSGASWNDRQTARCFVAAASVVSRGRTIPLFSINISQSVFAYVLITILKKTVSLVFGILWGCAYRRLAFMPILWLVTDKW